MGEIEIRTAVENITRCQISFTTMQGGRGKGSGRTPSCFSSRRTMRPRYPTRFSPYFSLVMRLMHSICPAGGGGTFGRGARADRRIPPQPMHAMGNARSTVGHRTRTRSGSRDTRSRGRRKHGAVPRGLTRGIIWPRLARAAAHRTGWGSQACGCT